LTAPPGATERRVTGRGRRPILALVSLLDDLKRDRARLFAIAASHGARELRVFGSVARREELPASDVDLLVRLDPDRSLVDLCALGDDLADAIGRRVDVLTDAAVSPYLRERIVSEALPL
jgi:predicted nucleotidyltransferase